MTAADVEEDAEEGRRRARRRMRTRQRMNRTPLTAASVVSDPASPKVKTLDLCTNSLSLLSDYALIRHCVYALIRHCDSLVPCSFIYAL